MSSRRSAKGKQRTRPQVMVGRILVPVGLRGEVGVEVFSDVSHRFAPGSVVHVGGFRHQVQHGRTTGKGLVVKFYDVESRDAAEALRGQPIYVREKDVPPPPEDTYYYYQVLGMQVVTVEGEEVGAVTEILTTGANDVYVVRREGKETLVPAIADVVVEVDVERRRMVVDLPEGL